jgi:phosphatidylserine/phosphatidylglycerophosphate/cardiolipin synthase-like enzyme/uncharacterized membrane protein YdjX (TVP38/TMEM64 family)
MPAGESLLDPGRNCWRSSCAPRAATLIDAEIYFAAFAATALKAQRSIVVLAWDFDSRTRLFRDEPGRKSPPAALGPFLNYLAHRTPDLHVYVLDWDYPFVYGTDREFPPMYGLGWVPHRRVHFRFDNTHPVAGSHHQKIVVVDDAVAFAGGLDLTNRRWDTCEHRGDDPRRVCAGVPYPPFHDVMAMVDGEPARALGELARERWYRATGEVIPTPGIGPDPWPAEVAPELRDVAVGIARTVPPTETSSAIREVEALYLDMIAAARDCIYIENQYFTSPALTRALEARLAQKDGPQVVLVLRLLSHGWLEEHTMEVLRTQMVRRLRAADRHGRFGVFYPHVPGLREGTCVDVHSKVMVVDDQWSRIGSANLCNRSMGMDTECDLVFEARGDARDARAIAAFRNRLLAEHLDVKEDVLEKACRKAGSLLGGIEALRNDEGRSLRALGDRQWPDAVVELASLADLDQPVTMDNLVERMTTTPAATSSRSRWKLLAASVLVLAGLTALWRYTPLAQYVTADKVTSLAETFSSHWWAPLLLIAAYTPACLTMFPRPLITLFAVVAFGPWLGSAYAMAGILAAAAVTYLLGGLLDAGTVRRFAGPKLNHVSEILRERGLLAVTALRLVPLAPFAVEGLVAGAIRIKWWHFMLGSWLGILPGTLATTVFGQQISAALRDPGSINYGLIAGVVALMVLGAWAVKRWLFSDRPRKGRRSGRSSRRNRAAAA